MKIYQAFRYQGRGRYVALGARTASEKEARHHVARYKFDVEAGFAFVPWKDPRTGCAYLLNVEERGVDVKNKVVPLKPIPVS